jgi:hypothetical protein
MYKFHFVQQELINNISNIYINILIYKYICFTIIITIIIIIIWTPSVI